MLRTRVIPVLLLKDNGLVKTIRFKRPKYVGDPVNAVKIFNEKEVDELIILDITATQQHREPDYGRIKEIVSEAFMPLGYGGGISSINQMERLFKVGIEKVVINSAAHTKPDLLTKASEIFGSQSIVVSIDIKKTILSGKRIFTHAGRKMQNIDFIAFSKKMEDSGAGELFVTSVDRDGTMTGYDLDIVMQISHAVSIPVVACGGAGKIDHFTDVLNAGASAVAAGSMFVFQGPHRAVLISYPNCHELETKLTTN